METGAAHASDGIRVGAGKRSTCPLDAMQFRQKTNVPVVDLDGAFFARLGRRRLNENVAIIHPARIENTRDEGARKTRSFERRESRLFVADRRDGPLIPAELCITEDATSAIHDLQGRLLSRC